MKRMGPLLVALSGPVAAGKSTLGKLLADRCGASVLKTNELIRARLPKTPQSRGGMQRAGDALDRETDGSWVAEEVMKRLQRGPDSDGLFVVDSVRIEGQIAWLRRGYGTSSVIHIHLAASDASLAARYATRTGKYTEFPDYARARANRTERAVRKLAESADVVIDTDRCSPADVFARIAPRLGFRPDAQCQLVDILVGGQYGSEGKGNIVHYLAPEYDVLVRVGGPNAGHKVFRDGEPPFTFHHLPSGALANGDAHLVLGAGAVINVEKLLKEIADLALPVDRLTIDERAMVIEARDIELEQRFLKDEIGSTAQGVGAATARKILNRTPGSDVRLARDIPELRHYIGSSLDLLEGALTERRRVLIEGTQGTSLSLHHGYYPHVTSRVPTSAGCLAEVGLAPRHVRRVVMVCRTYPIRVGNTDTGKTSGWMSREISLDAVAGRSGIPLSELERVERTSTTNRDRRIAEFDWEQYRRSLTLNGPTDIALTFVDYLSVRNRDAYRYEQLTQETLRFVEELEKVGGVPVSLISTRFDLRNIIDRRAW